MSTFESFERAKVRRLIVSKGKSFKFYRSVLNEFKEPTDDSFVIGTIKGVYHEATYSYLKETIKDGGLYHPEIESMILCLKEEISNALNIGDYTIINNRKYTVIKKKDINNLGIAWDISLEDQDNECDS